MRLSSFQKTLLSSTFLLALAVLILFGVYFGIIRNTASAKLARQVEQAPEIKKQYQLDKLSLVLPAKDANSVQVAVGDTNAKTFTPDLTISRWDGEVSMKIKPDVSAFAKEDKNLSFDAEKIKFKTPEAEYHFYDKPDASKDGGYEFEIVYGSKPAGNVVEIPIEINNLDFFYQSAFTEKYQAGGKIKGRIIGFVTETEVKDETGKVITSCPENVVGSYAVYYKNGKSGDYSLMGGKNYMAGKAFHIYRPKVFDANGQWVWAELKIDTTAGKLIIAVPQDFLDKAVYPVTVDPTFGWFVAGVSINAGGFDLLEGSFFTSPADAASINSISAYAYEDSGTASLKGVVVLSSTKEIVADADGVGTGVAMAHVEGWATSTLSANPAISALTEYILMIIASEAYTYHYDDMGAGNYQWFDNSNVYASPSDPIDGAYDDWRMTIYATYTATPGKATYVADGLVGWWTFNGEDIDDYSNTAYDRSSSYNGTITNMATSTRAVPGISGQGMNFDGVDDEIDILGMSFVDSFSISFWMKTSTAGGVWEWGWGQFIFGGIDSSNKAYFTDNGDSDHGPHSITSVNDSQWHHVVCTLDSSNNMLIYVDGNYEGSHSDAPSNTSGTIFIGRDQYHGYYPGLIDEVRVYNRALGADEIDQLYRADSARAQINTPLSGRFKDSSLVGYWSFDGPSMNSGQALDDSGNNNTGTLNGGVKKTIGINGQALNFDGVDDYVDTGSSVLFDSTKPLTISFWADVTNSTSGGLNGAINLKTSQATGFTIMLVKNFGTAAYNGVTFGSNANFVILSDTGDTSANFSNKWMHVVLVFDGVSRTTASSYTLYENAIQKTLEVPGVFNPSENVNRIGRGDTTTTYFGGLIDEVRIYNRALSAAEIAEQYRAGAARMKVNTPITLAGPQSGLVGNWTFNGQDISGTTAYDRSGQSPANNGTISGATPAIGKVGQALSFDGVDDYVETDNDPIGSGNATINVWIYPQSNDSKPLIISDGKLKCYIQDWIAKYSCSNDDGVTEVFAAANSLSLNEWQMFTAVRKSDGTFTLYLDGVQSGDADQDGGTIDMAGAYVIIGRRPWPDYQYFDGLIDEVRVYNRALGASEIQQLYNLGARKVKF